jgi:RNA polymerase sigma-70 factor (ECF subfamily)
MGDGAVLVAQDCDLSGEPAVLSGTDAQLLEEFVSCRSQAAYAGLVRRHGKMVLDVCRQVLRDEHAAEDAFQITFLVLARNAATQTWHASIDGWLHTVARRVALHERSSATRRQKRLADLAFEPQDEPDPLVRLARQELSHMLGAELRGLPEKYRVPMMLCYLEGMSNREAAERLGWPTGSISRRLARARAMLRERTRVRALAFAVGLLGAVIVAAFACLALPLSRFGTAPIVGKPRPAEQAIVADVMRRFNPEREGGEGIASALVRFERSTATPTDPERERLASFAARTAQAAESILDQHPGQDSQKWRSQAEEMRRSALALADALRSRRDDDARAEGRRLSLTCTTCHASFRNQ